MRVMKWRCICHYIALIRDGATSEWIAVPNCANKNVVNKVSEAASKADVKTTNVIACMTASRSMNIYMYMHARIYNVIIQIDP